MDEHRGNENTKCSRKERLQTQDVAEKYIRCEGSGFEVLMGEHGCVLCVLID